jgi:hypothetical protein
MNTRIARESAGNSWVINLFWLAMAAIMLFVSYRLINPIYHEYYLNGKVEEICRNGAQRTQTKVEDLRSDIIEVAAKEKIPLKEEDIDITKRGTSVFIHLTYEEPVNLGVTKWVRKVTIEKNSSEMGF